MAVDDMELRLLGTLEASLGARQRAANGVTPDEERCRQTLAEMIDLERQIDAETIKERSTHELDGPGRGRHRR
jgi:hypothetical protein